MTSTILSPAPQSLPVAPYLGGKIKLAKTITAILDSLDHETYAEPFVGMGGIFLRRKLRPKVEVINDYARDISNLFRILQRHYPQFLDMLRFQVTSRTEFNRLTDINPNDLTDLERAARFLYLQRTGFGGKVSERNYGANKTRPARFNLLTLESMLEDLHTRLAGVAIECLDYADFIPRYDSPNTLFYLDPPYWNCETDYGKGLFSKDDFAKLANLLSQLKGRFLMSINDMPEVRKIFARFHLSEVRVSYSISKKNDAKNARGELLVSNFKTKA